MWLLTWLMTQERRCLHQRVREAFPARLPGPSPASAARPGLDPPPLLLPALVCFWKLLPEPLGCAGLGFHSRKPALGRAPSCWAPLGCDFDLWVPSSVLGGAPGRAWPRASGELC